MTINEIESELSTVLNSRRYQHTLGVSYTAASLAMCYGCNIEKARIAGLLHDCAKCLSDTELLQTAREHELPISESEEADPYLLHGKVGAYFAENKYGITDPDILSAIVFHTTGRPNMTLLEEIIFVAVLRTFFETSDTPFFPYNASNISVYNSLLFFRPLNDTRTVFALFTMLSAAYDLPIPQGPLNNMQ